MELQEQRLLKLLNEVEKNEDVTQRALSRKLGVALGLTNLYVKRLARKGYIKIRTIPRNRIKYLLTPRGVLQKSKLTYEYMQYSFVYYREVRQVLGKALIQLAGSGSKQVVIYGTGELAEMAYLCVLEVNLQLVAFIDYVEKGRFLSCPVLSVEALPELEFDAVLVASLENLADVTARMIRLGIPKKKIVTLRLLA
ncbi:MAG: winged helix-turn-helix transcriptional regulator [Nitrospirae bacterium]|nr:MAG: winged helix-turn-helix transcriptional regulator [Nitrospirota bacterium]